MTKQLILIIWLCSIAWCGLVEDDPNIPNLFEKNFVNSGTSYSQEFFLKMASESGPSQPPIFDSFNDPSVRQQLRKNVLKIIDKMLSMQNSSMSGCALQRLSEAKAIREIYFNETIFSNRPLPRYYHASKQIYVELVLDSMTIKFVKEGISGAWFATGFFNMYGVQNYHPVFSFGSDLELPLSEVSNRSHYILNVKPLNYYGLGVLHNVSMWKNNTDMIQWGVERQYVKSIVNHITTNYDSEKASFLLSRMVPIDQMVLERQLLTIAHAHSNDRANALLVGSLYISDLPRFSNSSEYVTAGQVIMDTSIYQNTFYYCMVVANNETSGEISYLNLAIPNRETKLLSKSRTSKDLVFFNKFVPDSTITDMTELVRLIADGKLLDQPPPTTIKLERSVKRMMTRATKFWPFDYPCLDPVVNLFPL